MITPNRYRVGSTILAGWMILMMSSSIAAAPVTTADGREVPDIGPLPPVAVVVSRYTAKC